MDGLCGTVLPSSTGHGFFQAVGKGVVGWFDELGPLGWLPAAVAQALSTIKTRGSPGRVVECLEDGGGECRQLLVEDWEGVCPRSPLGWLGGEGGRGQSQASFGERETGNSRGEAKQLFQACSNGCVVAVRKLLGQGRGRGTKNCGCSVGLHRKGAAARMLAGRPELGYVPGESGGPGRCLGAGGPHIEPRGW